MFWKKSADAVRIAELEHDNHGLSAALLNRNKELIKLRAQKAEVGKALSEVLAERDEARAELAKFKRGLSKGAAASAAARRKHPADASDVVPATTAH